MTVAFVALLTSAGLQFTGWGKGKLNWGPRVGGLWLVAAGEILVVAGNAGYWVNRGLAWIAGWVGDAVAWAFGGAAGAAAASVIQWLPAALIGAYLVAAWIPGKWFGERFTWRHGWVAFVLPAFLGAVPGVGGDALQFVYGWAADAGTWIINAIFFRGA